MRVLSLSQRQDLEVAIEQLRTFAGQGRLTVLAGAGISRACPSELPLSGDVVKAAGKAIASRLGRPSSILLDHRGEPMRLEPFLRVVAQLGGFPVAERILDVLRTDYFNHNHASLAALIALHGGCSAICLNFDYLIEEAARSRYGLELEPLLPGSSTPDGGGNGSAQAARLVKPHGTLLKGGGSAGIVATIQEIEARVSDPVWSATQGWIEGRALFVTGYSNDDIDVFPCVSATRPSAVLWNTHRGVLPARVQEWLGRLTGSVPVWHLVGPCEKILAEFPSGEPGPLSCSHGPDVERHMEVWAGGIGGTALLASIGAWLAQDRHRVQESMELYEMALESQGADLDLRRYVRFRYAELLRHQAENKRAAFPQYALVLASAAMPPSDPHLALAAVRSTVGMARSKSHRVGFPGNVLLATAAAFGLGVLLGSRRVLKCMDPGGRLARREWSGSWLDWEMGMVLLGVAYACGWPQRLRTNLLRRSLRFFRVARRSIDVYERTSGSFGEARVMAALGRVCGDRTWNERAIRRLTRAEEVFTILDDVTGIKNAERLRSSIESGEKDPWLEER